MALPGDIIVIENGLWSGIRQNPSCYETYAMFGTQTFMFKNTTNVLVIALPGYRGSGYNRDAWEAAYVLCDGMVGWTWVRA